MRYFALLLTFTLVAGCASKSKEQKELEAAQKQSKPPDKFESSDDPPLNANTRFAAGQLAESMGDAQKAIAQYSEAIKLEPKHRDALFRLGSLLTQQRRYPEAIDIWRKYIDVTDGAAAAYNNLAYTQEVAGQVSEAEKTYQACVERDPKQQACRVNYGHMLARHGRIDDAVAQLSAVLKPAEVTYNLGAVYQQQGKIEQAKAYYRKALEQDPNLRDAQAALARLK